MEKNEHILFQDIPTGRNGKFHSAILTTYAIDLVHFDNHIRNTLHRKLISSINVLADCNQMDKSLQYTNPIYLPHIGQDYCISSIRSNGAFHSKINFFIGDESVLVLIGSGNLTVTGHGKNHEVFTGFMIDKNNESQRPLIEECWQYLKQFASQTSNFEQRRILQEVPANCLYLNDEYKIKTHIMHPINDNLQAALLYTESKNSILSQIADLVPLDEVSSITVVSPYFDEDGATLHHLLKLCPHAKMDVLIQELCSLPPSKMALDSRMCFYNFDETIRGKLRIKNYNRLAHAKIIHFKTDNAEYCIIGSANATKAGIGTMERRGINEEFCVLYTSSTTDFLDELGLKTCEQIDIDLENIRAPKKHNLQPLHYVVKLLSASYENGWLTLEMNNKVDTLLQDSCIILDNGRNVQYFKEFHVTNNVITLKVEFIKESMLCAVMNKVCKVISNKVFINRIEQLDTTNPSPSIRKMNNIISYIESKGYNGLEIVDMLTDVMLLFLEDMNDKNSRISPSSSKFKKKDETLPQIKYNPDYDNDHEYSNYSTRYDKSSKLIECIEKSIRRKLRSMDEDIKDEEESGDCETSNERSLLYDNAVVVDKKDVCFYSRQAASLLQNYKHLISRRIEICNKQHGNLTKDDFCFFALSMFTSLEICYLSRFHYDFGSLHSWERGIYQKKLYDSLDRVMEHEAIDAIQKFATLCQRYDRQYQHDADFIKKGHRAIKYALLYYTCFSRFSSMKQFCEKKVIENICILIDHFGIPNIALLKSEIYPLIIKYDHIFEFKDIEKAVIKLGYSW